MSHSGAIWQERRQVTNQKNVALYTEGLGIVEYESSAAILKFKMAAEVQTTKIG